MFLLVPAYPGCPGSKAVKRSLLLYSNQCFALLVGWQEGHPACKNRVVGCWHGYLLERGADLHMAQLMPLPVTVSCFSKIQIGFTFLVPAHPGSPGQRAVKRVCVCVCVFKLLETIEHSLNVSKSNCNFMMLACMMTMAQNRPLWRLMSMYGATHS